MILEGSGLQLPKIRGGQRELRVDGIEIRGGSLAVDTYL